MTFEIISKSSTNKFVSFFLPSKAVESQSLHSQSFYSIKKGSRIKMKFITLLCETYNWWYKTDKLATSFMRICGQGTQMYKFSKLVKCKQFPYLHAPNTLDLTGFAWQISAHSCTACVRSISAKGQHREEVKTHPEIDKACSVTTRIRVVRSLPANSAKTYQDSLKQSVLFGW